MNKDKFLIMQLGRFGDLILFSPIFRILKEKFPSVELHLLAGRKNYEVILGNPYIDKIIKYDKSPSKLIHTIFQIRKDYYQYWIDPRDHFSNESRILAKIARAKHKIGFNQANLKAVFDLDIKQNENLIHHSLIGINSLSHLGIALPAKPIKPELFFMKDERFSPDSTRIIENNLNFVLLNLSASGTHKMWQVENWIEFISQTESHKKTLVINFMNDERPIAEQIKERFSNVILHQPQNIRDVMALVYHSRYVITPDTAIVHIASAFNKKIFALYSGLDDFYAKFHPTSDNYTVVRAKNGDKGIHSITVLDAVQNFLQNF